tara:strand:+ start:116 stop:385 length:270 start_codon:yes stop_codon:yes gene_type:complete
MSNCPICNRTVKITKTGKVARHGHGHSDGGFLRNLGGRCVAGGGMPSEAGARLLKVADYYLSQDDGALPAYTNSLEQARAKATGIMNRA